MSRYIAVFAAVVAVYAMWSTSALIEARGNLAAARQSAAQARAASTIAGAAAASEARRAAEAAALTDEITAILEDHDVPLPPEIAAAVNGASERLRQASDTRRP